MLQEPSTLKTLQVQPEDAHTTFVHADAGRIHQVNRLSLAERNPNLRLVSSPIPVIRNLFAIIVMHGAKKNKKFG